MSQDRPYKAFTTEFDEVVPASELALRPIGSFHSFTGDDRSGLRPSAAAEAEELASGLPAFDGTLQVLLDMSGSNRGSHVETIACVDLLATALERAGIRFEVLGFTTSSWKGGKSRELWKVPPFEEREHGPGRLCDLLHVVFKEPDDGWRSDAGGTPSPAALLDALYRPPYLRENIDGEALRWAMSRQSGETRLLVFGDGRSIDDSTLSLNPAGILDDDRRLALAELEATGVEVAYVEVTRVMGGEPRDGVDRFDVSTPPAEVARAALERILAPAAPSPGR